MVPKNVLVCLWLNYAVLRFFTLNTYFDVFAAKLGCYQLYLVDSRIFALLFHNWAIFTLLVPRAGFSLFVDQLHCFTCHFTGVGF